MTKFMVQKVLGTQYLPIINIHHIIHIIWKISLNFQIYIPYDPKISKSIGQKIKFCDFFSTDK